MTPDDSFNARIVRAMNRESSTPHFVTCPRCDWTASVSVHTPGTALGADAELRLHAMAEHPDENRPESRQIR